jgi:hypothetical protein
MPKIAKKSNFGKMRKFIKDFGDVLSINKDGLTKKEILFCQSCMVRVICDQKSRQTLHDSGLHRNQCKAELKT